MLGTIQKADGITYFHKIETEEGWKVIVVRNNTVLKETECLTEEHANIVRAGYVNDFWGFKLN
jgi:very-short-patch-repair endonuclease